LPTNFNDNGVWGQASPIFIKKLMSIKEKAYQLLMDKLEEHPEFFLIDFAVSENNDIKVILDGDQGINVQNLVDFSRAIEHHLDREEEDFSLMVSSFDISQPFHHIRQFKKNLGREIKVKTENGEIKGKLVKIGDDEIVLEFKIREPKPIGKGKHTVVKKEIVPLDQIKEAKVVIKF